MSVCMRKKTNTSSVQIYQRKCESNLIIVRARERQWTHISFDGRVFAATPLDIPVSQSDNNIVGPPFQNFIFANEAIWKREKNQFENVRYSLRRHVNDRLQNHFHYIRSHTDTEWTCWSFACANLEINEITRNTSISPIFREKIKMKKKTIVRRRNCIEID